MASPEQPKQIVADPNLDSEAAYADSIATYSTSLASSAIEYRHEFGRQYHSFREERKYFLPNDEAEQDRTDLLHGQMMMVLDNNLYFAPLDNPERVLDIGTGTGIWAIDFADTHPSSHVVGNDLSPIQPGYVPPNLEFVVDDIEDDWTYHSKPFDFIHARYLAGAIRNWPRLVGQTYACTKPGGWVEFQDWDTMVQSPDGSVPHDSAFWRWHEETLKRVDTVATGRPGPQLERWVRESGFENITVKEFAIPHSVWPKDEKMKKIGAFNHAQWEAGLEGITIGCLNRAPSEQPAWSLEECRKLADEARKDARNAKYHGQYSFYVVYGQKPAK